jgi:uncharacterized protein with von Willebrand factor type A (vWA) domain
MMRHIYEAIRNSGLPIAAAFVFAFVSHVAVAQTPDYGKLRAAIRSADYSCAHVQKVSDAGNDAWNVQCNSGLFLVTRIGDGEFSVIKKAPSE